MNKKNDKMKYNIKNKILGIAIILIALYYLYVLFSPHNSPTFINNIVKYINQYIGLGRYAIFVFLLAEGISLVFNIYFPHF